MPPSGGSLLPPLAPYVSTGRMPPPALVTRAVNRAYERFRSRDGGAGRKAHLTGVLVRPEPFGICVVSNAGGVYAAGDTDSEFPIGGISMPFVFALVCQYFGAEVTRARLGVNGTGLRPDSLGALDRTPDGRTNALAEPGAITTTSMIPGTDAEERWQFITTGLSRLAGRGLSLDGDAYAAALTSRARGLSIALLLQSRHLIDSDPDETVDLYMRQGAISVSARDLATMAATLASGGINPMTKQAAVDPQSCRHTLAVMATAGFHETSGDWLYDTGLPAASGAAGAIVAASPGKGGASILAPPADCTGCSVRGRLVATFLAERLGLNLFLSKPDP